jgi:glycogen debranching enzyme
MKILLSFVLFSILWIAAIRVDAALLSPELEGASQLTLSLAPRISDGTAASLEALAANFFAMPFDQDPRWLSVSGKAGYVGQYYSRDTFLSLRGGIFAGPAFTQNFANAVSWFSAYQSPDGHIPLWFRQENEMHAYQYCPYNHSAQDGGVIQPDALEDYIDGAALVFAWSGDRNWLLRNYPHITAAWEWLHRQSDASGLLYLRTSAFCGADWEDAIRRTGYATYAEEGWYHATLSMQYLAAAVGDRSAARRYAGTLKSIYSSFNRILWRVSVPRGYRGKPFGHYMGWVENNTPHDYFEVDSNARAIATGLASERYARSILQFVNDNRSALENRSGAFRTVFGHYDTIDTDVGINKYQNGGYWYLPSMYVAMAYRRMGYASELAGLAERLGAAAAQAPLGEWYDAGGYLFGAPEYSWSEATMLYVSYGAVAGLQPAGENIALLPCLSPSLGDVSVTLSYRGIKRALSAQPGCTTGNSITEMLFNS